MSIVVMIGSSSIFDTNSKPSHYYYVSSLIDIGNQTSLCDWQYLTSLELFSRYYNETTEYLKLQIASVTFSPGSLLDLTKFRTCHT